MDKKHKIMIIDDSAASRDTLAALLMLPEYDIRLASGGEDGLRKVTLDPPDLILLDVMMQRMDGLEVCRRLKASRALAPIPVILVTALNQKEDIINGLEAGADDFVSKPCNGAELRARVRSMLRIKSQYDSLQRVFRVREEMANLIVHDIRSPLNQIAMAAEYLTTGMTSEENAQFLNFIRDGVAEIDGLVNNLLFYAKSESERLVLNRSPYDIAAMVRSHCERLKMFAETKEIDLVCELPDRPVEIHADRNLISRVLANLINNALKHTALRTPVKVDLEVEGEGLRPGFLRIDVSDEGRGVDAKNRELIFEKFHGKPEGEAITSSYGLGLYFCRMVIEAHGGSINLLENAPQGSVFRVEFPVGSALDEAF